MDRITRKDAENALAHLVFALGGKLAKDYKDVGGYRLDKAYGGFNVERIVNEQGGVTQPFGAMRMTAREFVNRVRFALDVLQARVEQVDINNRNKVITMSDRSRELHQKLSAVGTLESNEVYELNRIDAILLKDDPKMEWLKQ